MDIIVFSWLLLFDFNSACMLDKELNRIFNNLSVDEGIERVLNENGEVQNFEIEKLLFSEDQYIEHWSYSSKPYSYFPNLELECLIKLERANTTPSCFSISLSVDFADGNDMENAYKFLERRLTHHGAKVMNDELSSFVIDKLNVDISIIELCHGDFLSISRKGDEDLQTYTMNISYDSCSKL